MTGSNAIGAAAIARGGTLDDELTDFLFDAAESYPDLSDPSDFTDIVFAEPVAGTSVGALIAPPVSQSLVVPQEPADPLAISADAGSHDQLAQEDDAGGNALLRHQVAISDADPADMIALDMTAAGQGAVPAVAGRRSSRRSARRWLRPVAGGAVDRSSEVSVAEPSPEEELAPEPPLVLARSQVLGGRYELLNLIGQGGMSQVFEAADRENDGQQVALKILRREFWDNDAAVNAFAIQAKRQIGLDHPGIVRVHEVGRDRGAFFLVMDLVKGVPLGRFIRERSPQGLPMERALAISGRIIKALLYAHQRGVVHADLKPSNIMLLDGDEIRLLDLGGIDPQGGKTSAVAGAVQALTPPYASWEQVEGRRCLPSDDIYALAIIIYEVLTGRHPYDRRPAREAFAARFKPVPIDGLSPSQWRALRSGLAFRRGDRPSSLYAFGAPLLGLRLRGTGVWGVIVRLTIGLVAAAVAFFL